MKGERKRIAFMGGKTVGYSCLNYLFKNRILLNIDVVCVFENKSKLISSSDSVSQLAVDYGVPVYYNQDKLLEIDNIDFIISVQYNEILKQIHINRAKKMAINLHMAPLPEYRGCNQFSFAIIDGVKEFGTSLHRLDLSVDGGDLIAEKRFPVSKNCFVQDLYNITLNQSVALFEEEIKSVLFGSATLIPQKNLPDNRVRGFHFRKEINHIKTINNTWPIEKQKRYFRATWFPPFSPPTELQSGKELDLNWYNSLV